MQIHTHCTLMPLTDNVDFSECAAHYRPLVVEIKKKKSSLGSVLTVTVPDGAQFQS